MDIQEILTENELLKQENAKLKSQLENYNNSRKSYYEKNKEHIKAQAKEGLKKLAEENPDKLKEYRRKAYLKRKEKINELNENI
jgi:cell division septum initiation protein DivIVA